MNVNRIEVQIYDVSEDNFGCLKHSTQWEESPTFNR